MKFVVKNYSEPCKLKPTILSNEIYAQAIESFVITCVDALIIDSVRKLVYLAKRRIEPAKDNWWVIGGRMWAGESYLHALQRHCMTDLGIKPTAHRLNLVAVNRYIWGVREQEPQDVGSDNMAFTFTWDLAEDPVTLDRVCHATLNPDEYEPGTFIRPFSREMLVVEKVHPAILDLYDLIFPTI